MYCRECGQQIKEGDAFCGNCGTPVEIKGSKQSENKRDGKNILGRLIICLVVILGIGAGVWFFLYKPNDDIQKDTAKLEESTEETDETEETDKSEESVEESGDLSYAASEYLKALLDNSYKNDSSQLVSMKIATAEEAAKIYEEELDAFVNTMLDGIYGLSDEEMGQWKQLFADIFDGAKYSVGESERQDDGSYVVAVTYQKMKVYGSAAEAFMELAGEKMQEWDTAYENGEESPSDVERTVWAAMILKDCIEESLKSVTYDEERILKVKVVQSEENVWTTSNSDIENLREALFDSTVFY